MLHSNILIWLYCCGFCKNNDMYLCATSPLTLFWKQALDEHLNWYLRGIIVLTTTFRLGAFCGNSATPFSVRILLARPNFVENIPLVGDNFLVIGPLFCDFNQFQPKYSLYKKTFRKTCPKRWILGIFVKNRPLVRDSRRKRHPWIGDLGSISDHLRHTPSKIQVQFFFQDKSFENVFCKMLILSMFRYW